MATRIPSIFSVSSNHSDQSSDSRLGSSVHPARPSKEQTTTPAYTQKPVPDLRPTGNLQTLHNNHSSGLTPPFNPTLLPHVDDDDPLMQRPQYLTSLPQSSDSPNGSRPTSISNAYPNGVMESARLSPPSYLNTVPLGLDSPTGSRPASLAGSCPPSQPSSRPASPNTFRPITPTGERKLSKRRSWLPGKTNTGPQIAEHVSGMPQPWIVTPQEKLPYDTTALANFHRVPELWNESGDTFVYLHARECGRGPSFKVDSSTFASSRKLVQAAHGGAQDLRRQQSSNWQQRSFVERVQHLTVNAPASPPASRPGSSHGSSSKGSRSVSDSLDETTRGMDIHLCLPMPLQADLSNPQARPTSEDVESLITIRNVFAFLLGQPLVATKTASSMFTICLKIADVMQRYEFTNLDGSTLGEDAEGNFARCIQEFGLADVRASREKTIEAIVLGERMRSWELYNEGFVHAVGKYDEIVKMKSPKFYLITDITRKRLERAHLDLLARLRNIQTRLDDFDFPSLFAGFANSTTSSESKVIRFKEWKNSYMSMRRHVMNLYKHRYGAWPPKAKSKKNDFEESGLNRLLLQEVYRDFSDLYDILVDRSALTTRSMELRSPDGQEDPQGPTPRALRRILDEYDLSTAPVQPPVPFDVPRVPSLSTTRRGFDALDPKRQKKEAMKKLGDDEINNALMQSYNRDSVKSTPFLESFMAYERKSAHGKSICDIADLRHGQWIFMYAVLQSLPLLVVDAPAVKWSKGVEYFLCEVPKGSAPWITSESSSLKQSWYGIAGGSGMVSLPADVVEHGVDGIYRRSHCWQAAEKWAGYGEIAKIPQPGLPFDRLLPPTMPSQPGSRAGSPEPRRASMTLGLEQLPLPPGVAPSGARPLSMHDPTKTFGAILAQSDGVGKKKR